MGVIKGDTLDYSSYDVWGGGLVGCRPSGSGPSALSISADDSICKSLLQISLEENASHQSARARSTLEERLLVIPILW